ncbi:sulfite exporter TauE/SafE family protein [Pseudomonas petrae]|uniref:Probable membrane transporter protein n=1 Tax=Pseudomonas petrae TaxID=2912190 RepID=A0ABS9IAZ5_9PSED|nr:sulfite exporter TauE/SafE family protein [Pseudomonas petrae]MCF7530963.1 sulfite exporter TauE/SafE family protein [Pseudomonas petrae]MCF7536637.1 sulfite exporter TauE/SafE family protein [Pseudomonas petrae]MCF7544248.1 sulfite exporter TauE/SafE family protein [Pseudomonas petrae]MCF7554317.1 sulfite exporter TauE/SafE family protein [Pseudomonas petrae]
MDFLLYLALGGCAGVLAGLFGVGGGLIIVPVLVFSFTLQGFDSAVLTHLAVGTSLATIIFTTILSVRAHHRAGAVRWLIFGWMTVGILVGAVMGSVTASLIAGPTLQKIIGVFAIVMAVKMALDYKPKVSRDIPGKSGLAMAGVIIGWASAIFGIGGGSLTVPFLTWRGLTIQQAVATSAACGFPTAVVGTISFMMLGWQDPLLPEHSLGFIYLPALVGIAITSMSFAPFGAKLAHRLSPKKLKLSFAVMLVVVGISFLA